MHQKCNSLGLLLDRVYIHIEEKSQPCRIKSYVEILRYSGTLCIVKLLDSEPVPLFNCPAKRQLINL